LNTGRQYIAIFVSLVLVLSACTSQWLSDTPPKTKKLIVKEIMHNVDITDSYRWLEDWNDPEVGIWDKKQNIHTQDYFDNISFKTTLHNRVSDILGEASVRYTSPIWRSGRLFALKHQSSLNQPVIVTMPSANEPEVERIVFDPNQMDSSGHTSIDWFVPSPDGKLIAVSLSVNGTMSGNLYIFEIAGSRIDKVIKNVNKATAGGDVAWLVDGSGFYYTRYPAQGERSEEELDKYQQVWFHQIRTSLENDLYIIGKNFPDIAEIRLEMDHSSNRLLVTVQHGDSYRFSHYIVDSNKTKKRITTYEDGVSQATFGPSETLFLISQNNAPKGKVLRLSLKEPFLEKAKVIIPEIENPIVYNFWFGPEIVVTETGVYVIYQLGGPCEIQSFDLDGNKKAAPKLLPISSVSRMIALNDDDILFENESYINPPSWYWFDASSKATKKSALSVKTPVDFSDTEVIRKFAISKDGTKIPINIVKPKNIVYDGSNATLLHGYGGYGLSKVPNFNAVRRIWIEHGGVFAIANIRGGSEYGEEWHRAGMLTKKQNVFDDFSAAMKYLVDNGYTSHDKLAIFGDSNGGLLMGAMITQHPNSFKAAVSFVGIYDMLRYELSPNGTFNIPEFGSVKNLEHFKALYAYSPYHNIQGKTVYPSIFLVTGENDNRVDPMHSRKMAAGLQAATSSNNPILLRIYSNTGHGAGMPSYTLINVLEEMYSFLFNELDVPYKINARLKIEKSNM